MSVSCPACGEQGEGRFCAHCGTDLRSTRCAECGHEPPSGARFCNQCGAARVEPALGPPETAAAPAAPAAAEEPSGTTLPWLIAGAALVALIAVLLLPRFGEEVEENPLATRATPQAPMAGFGAPTGDARAVDLGSMTPREAADRLFNRVMQNVSAGDTAAAREFLPMALAAYERVDSLDLDGHYHVAVLRLVGDEPDAARAQAEQILQREPDHLFGLFTAAQAEQARGDVQAARALYQRFLERYPVERERDLAEYAEHEQLLPFMRDEAERQLQAIA